MARSQYIYIITTQMGKVVPFTVKHEAVRFLTNRASTPFGLVGVQIRRYRDGQSEAPIAVWLDAKTFMES